MAVFVVWFTGELCVTNVWERLGPAILPGIDARLFKSILGHASDTILITLRERSNLT